MRKNLANDLIVLIKSVCAEIDWNRRGRGLQGGVMRVARMRDLTRRHGLAYKRTSSLGAR